MAKSPVLKYSSCALFLCMVVVIAPHAEAALTCGTVTQKIGQCLSYLQGAPAPSAACCAAITALKSMAATPSDRQIACGCLKSAAKSIHNINFSKATSLPGKCGVTVPYAISPNTDCSKVH